MQPYSFRLISTFECKLSDRKVVDLLYVSSFWPAVSVERFYGSRSYPILNQARIWYSARTLRTLFPLLAVYSILASVLHLATVDVSSTADFDPRLAWQEEDLLMNSFGAFLKAQIWRPNAAGQHRCRFYLPQRRWGSGSGGVQFL